jgi:hypothetical protein
MNLVSISARRSALVTVFVLALGGAAAGGQQKPQAEGGGTLTIDFTAVTADGKPVTDLSPTDVTIRVAGRVRSIADLSLQKIEAAGAPTAKPADAISPPFSSNEATAGGRSFMIVIDADSLRAGTEPPIRQAVEALLAGLTDADRVAFSVVPRDTAQVGFGSVSRVRDALAAFKAQRPASVSGAENLCRTKDSLVMLQSLMEPLAGKGTPTSVLFIAATLSTPGQASSATAGSCEVTKDHYQAIVSATAEARANLYVIQADAASQGRSDGLENLAGVTQAGSVMRVTGDGFAPHVLTEASSYWVATLAADPSDRPGQFQRLEVRPAREGVTIRARAEAFIPRAAQAAKAGGGSATSPRDMIRTAAPFTDLQLRAVAYSSRGALDKMNVLVIAEPVDPTVKITAMRVGFFDQAGQGSSTDAPQIATYPITTALPLGVGPYRIRVAATDASGKSGAVDIPVDTTLTPAGPLKLGGLLLGAPTPTGSLKPQVVFSTEEKVLAYLEMYGQITGNISAKFELAKSDTGPAITTLPPAGGGPTNEPDKFQINGDIPIAKLEPGDYVIRVLVQLEGQPEGRVLRTFRKVAK